MQLVDELKVIFQDTYFELKPHEITLQETGKEAKVKSASFFVNEGDLLHIRKEFFDSSKELFIKNCQHPIIELEHCCDGVVISEEEKEIYVFLVELKSAYTKDNIEKAFNQLRASYLKIAVHLNAFKQVNIAQIHFGGILIALPISSENLTKYKKN